MELSLNNVHQWPWNRIMATYWALGVELDEYAENKTMRNKFWEADVKELDRKFATLDREILRRRKVLGL